MVSCWWSVMEYLYKTGPGGIMSTLVLDELYDGVIAPESFTTDRDLDVSAIRVHLYKHDTSTTELTLRIYQDAVLLDDSTVTAAELNTAIPETYSHGMVRFEFTNLALRLKEGESRTVYRWELEGTGGSETNFIGVVRIYENKIYLTTGEGVVNGEAPNDFVEPFHFEIFEYKYT